MKMKKGDHEFDFDMIYLLNYMNQWNNVQQEDTHTHAHTHDYKLKVGSEPQMDTWQSFAFIS